MRILFANHHGWEDSISFLTSFISFHPSTFWHFQATLARSLPMQTCHTSSPLQTGSGIQKAVGSPSTWAQMAAISRKPSWRKCFTTKGRDSNVESNFYVCTVTPRKQERRKRHSNENGLVYKKQERRAGLQWDRVTCLTGWIGGDWEALEIKDWSLGHKPCLACRR